MATEISINVNCCNAGLSAPDINYTKASSINVSFPVQMAHASPVGAKDLTQFFSSVWDGTILDANLFNDWSSPWELWRESVWAGCSAFTVKGFVAFTRNKSEIQSWPTGRSVELLPIRQESVTGGFPSSCKKPAAGGAVEEDAVVWHLMKRLGVDASGQKFRFSAFPDFR
jgi:hypothetical protein